MRRGAACLPASLALAASLLAASLSAEMVIEPDRLLADWAIARDALETLHPGLYRYSTPGEMDERFTALRRRFERPMTRRDAYLAWAGFLAEIRCGHTYANFWNQSAEVQQELFDGADKVPFTFRILDGRMVVTGSAVDDPRLAPGATVVSIDGVPTPELLARLLPLMHADGGADHQRRFELGVTGIGEYEAFDVYFPLLFPVGGDGYRLEVVGLRGGDTERLTVPAMTREQRRAELERRTGREARRPDDLWRFELLDDTSAYLQAGSFVTWKMELDWRAFLDSAMATLAERGVENLILDVRDNGGGDDDVLAAILGHLAAEPIEIAPYRQRVRYERVPERLRPYLDSWDLSYLDLTGKVRATGDGYFTALDATDQPEVIPRSEDAFDGKVWLLINPANSSATFTLARTLREAGVATLVGQTTGGNLRGINGGQIFFLRLPNTGIEIDLPLIGYFPVGDAPDAGVEPDLAVEPTVADLAAGRDPVLAAVRERIAARSAIPGDG